MANRLFLAVVILSISAISLLGWAQTPRVVYWNPSKDISSQILPDDQQVVVVKARSPLQIGPPLTLEADLERINSTAAAIAVIDFESVEGVRTAKGDWAQTRVRGRVQNLVKSSERVALGSPDGTFEFYFDGGEIAFGKTTVRVGEYPLVKGGERYLIMFDLDPMALRWYPFQPFRVGADGRLSRVEFFALEPKNVPSPLDGQLLENIVRGFRKLQAK